MYDLGTVVKWWIMGRRKDSIAIKILKGVAMAGLVVVAASNPYFGLNLIKGFKMRSDKKAWRKFYRSLNYLDRRGYVKILDRGDDGTRVKITRAGEEVTKELDMDSMVLKRADQWDGKWRVIIFDVPVSKSKNRKAFTERIKELGLIMVQKSVWAYPYECYEELMVLRKFYGIAKYVTYFEAVEVEDEIEWRWRFNLKAQSAWKRPNVPR